MSEYQVIARKWRPQKFSDVVGQEHVLRTLKNAIKNHRTAHAYLFVGPRGVGKTTTARIFAKALNCTDLQDGEPCGKCPSCVAIGQDASLDVIEIDAASHNTADYMRELSEEALHLPVSGRYKIYIIDEVHMLSKAAWNSLLKTVEEPPAHVKFIFATTEAHAVLPTIVSRCQRFDLQPIQSNLIFERLKMIAQAENIAISDGALKAISRAASGGMRDAQSLLDQLTSFFSGADSGEIDEETVLAMFALSAADELEGVATAMLENSPAGVVKSVAALAARGRNLETLFDDLLSTLRGAELVQMLGSAANDILDADDESLQRYQRLASMQKGSELRILLESLSAVGRTLRDAVNKQVFLEATLLKAMRQAHAVKLEDVLARLNQLRKQGDLAFLDKIPAEPIAAPPPAPPAKPVEEKIIEVAPPEPEPPSPAPAAAPPTDAASESVEVWRRICENSAPDFSEKWQAMLKNAQVVSYKDHTLQVELPFDPAEKLPLEEVRTVEAQLLSTMQNVTGLWDANLLLDYPMEPRFEPEEHLIEPEAERVMPSRVDEQQPLPAPEVVDDPNGEFNDGEPGEADDYPDEPTAAPPAEAKPLTESVFGDPDELQMAKKEPAVGLIEDLFGAEIVDIHKIN